MNQIPHKVSEIFEIGQLEEILKAYDLLKMIEKCYLIGDIIDIEISKELKD